MINKNTLLICLLLSFFSCNRKQLQEGTIPVREDIEWLDVWLPNTNKTGLPRVLLIGNSITRDYYPGVEKLLEGRAFVERLSTSKSVGDPALLDEIILILKWQKFDIVHFNNGLHGWDYTEEEYKNAFPAFVETIRKAAPEAKLVWASTTPIRQGEDMLEFDARTQRVIERNKIADEYLSGKDIEKNDLYAFVIGHPEYYAGGDGTHLVPLGVSKMSEKVAEFIKGILEQP